MTDDTKYDALNTAIDGVVEQGFAASTGDEELDALARVASGLRGLPNPEFKARLRAQFLSEQSEAAPGGLDAWLLGLPGASWLRRQRLFLAGGSSCGVVAGTCCISGAAGYVLGLSSAAAVTAFIHSTIPYFIALSIISMIAWLGWLLRDQGITFVSVTRTLRQYGVALAGSYAVVFAASMALSMGLGLY